MLAALIEEVLSPTWTAALFSAMFLVFVFAAIVAFLPEPRAWWPVAIAVGLAIGAFIAAYNAWALV